MKTSKWYVGVSLVVFVAGCGAQRGSSKLDAMLVGLADADFEGAAADGPRTDARVEKGTLSANSPAPRDFVLPGESAIAWAIPRKRSITRVERPVGGSLWAQHAAKVGRLELGPRPLSTPR